MPGVAVEAVNGSFAPDSSTTIGKGHLINQWVVLRGLDPPPSDQMTLSQSGASIGCADNVKANPKTTVIFIAVPLLGAPP